MAMGVEMRALISNGIIKWVVCKILDEVNNISEVLKMGSFLLRFV
jgi:hypothetical protein